MSVELLTDHHLEFLSLKRGCTGLSESKLVKMPHCLKSHVKAHLFITIFGKKNLKTFENLHYIFRFQMLYADTYLTLEEFRDMFDHSLYDKMRREFDCEKAFPEVYGKVNRKVRD